MNGVRYMTDIESFADYINSAKKIVFFGGAGVSTESGLKDYRSADGIYNTAKNYGMPPEEILSRRCFDKNPELFYRFFRDYFMTGVEPNFTHKALVELERSGKHVAVVTQNIDGLHQLAGSKEVYEPHGTTSRFHCRSCGAEYDLEYVKQYNDVIPRCKCGAIIKPHVVLYGEMLDDNIVNGALAAISSADLLIIGGTSLAVQPAASFVRYFNGQHVVIINKESTAYDSNASLVFHEGLGKVFTQALERLKQ